MGSSKRIMVLDDSAMSLRFTRAYLEGLKFEVRTAGSVAEFTKTIRDFPPDIILTDVEMPDAAGDELCRVLRGNIATQDTPIILFSGLDPKLLEERAGRAGADGFVCKTDGPSALQAKIESLLASRK